MPALFARDSETRSLTLGVDGSFLNVGRVRARIAASNAQAAGELASYQKAVLTALEETENALVQVSRSEQQRQHLSRLLQPACVPPRRPRRASTGRHRSAGVAGCRKRVCKARCVGTESGRIYPAVVSLYRAMAGGWPEYVADEASNKT